MRKKTRKMIVRKDLMIPANASDKYANNESAPKSTAKAPVAEGKASMPSEDMAKGYQYVKGDLKTIALIAIPRMVGLIILSVIMNV
jgi:hypothetical protein